MQFTARQGIYIAALLHDIGKFWQRASASRYVLPDQVLKLSSDICPPSQYKSGDVTHLHALFTYAFFIEQQGILPESITLDGQEVSLGLLSARHHKQDLNLSERIIQFADWLSSGQDRQEDTHKSNESYSYKKKPLLSTFDTLYQIKSGPERSYFSLRAMDTSGAMFPEHKKELQESLEQDYAALWQAFTEEFKKLPQTSAPAFISSLEYLLRKYTWCIPSSTMDMPDISLYDHLKTTAAIADTLFMSSKALPESYEGLQQEEEERFVLFAGDFSGIQKFIYQISSKGAAKTLKGRSYYISLIQDVVIETIRALSGVFRSNVLMQSGGRFQLLLPNNEEVLERIQDFIDEVNLSLRRQFAGQLYLATGVQPFRAAELDKNTGFDMIVKAAYQNIEADKSKKFARVITEDFFRPGEVQGTSSEQVCHVTGMDLRPEDRVEETIGEDGETMVIARSVKEQRELGRSLRGATHLLKVRFTSGRRPLREGITPLKALFEKGAEYEGYGITYGFEEDLTQEGLQKLEQSNIRLLEVSCLNNTSFLHLCGPESDLTHSFQFYGAAWMPDDVEDKNGRMRTVEFTDIAQDDVNNLLGVLRMDVDNLGTHFREGYRHSQHSGEQKEEDLRNLGSISRYSTLSNQLDWFFSGYMNELLSEIYGQSEEVDPDFTTTAGQTKAPNQYILPVYAGGDDVFILTRWDLAPQLARRIYDDFKAFTSQHPKMSISGGIHLMHGKYPIHRAAEAAAGAEKAAKQLPLANGSGAGKDALTLFGVPLDWEDMALTTDLMRHLLQWQEKMGKRTLLNFMRNLNEEYSEQHHYGRWRWRSAYQLKRIGKEHKMEDEMMELASWLFTGVMNKRKPRRMAGLQTEPELIHLMGVVARWMQSLTRTTTKQQ